jgi:superfamily II DNA helicase RecQ
MNEDEDEDGLQLNEESGAMPESFHWQASHTPRTGNGAYASRIDYQGGLTDEGLNEYIRISNMWQALLAEGTDIQLSGGKHARGQSVEGSAVAPLLKRIALRHASQRYRRHWSMEEAKAALQDMYGPDAKYKSEWQERAVQAVVSGLTPVVVVLGTGEGKSLLYMLQQRLPGAGTTVIIVPLVVLKQDTVRRCQQMGIDCLVWDHAIGGRIGNELVLVSVDRALSQEFQDELQALSSSGRLSSIIVDECHLVVTASEYRPKMTMVREFRRYACQMVFLTATLPLHMMMAFADRFLLANAVVIRGPTLRKDIQYEVRRCVGMDVCREAVGLVQALLRLDLFVYDEKARLIVYCVTKDDVNAVADALGCQRYYSDSASHREKEQAMAEWMNGESRVMVATSAFGAGVDYHSVRSIVHVGVPDSTVDFAQEVGRGGRDGGGCISYVVVPRHWRSGNRRAGGELMAADQMAMQKYLDSPRCRQTVLGGYLDENSYVCESTQTMCDRCQGLGLVKKAQEDDEEKVEERLWMSTGGEEWGEGARRTEETQKQETRDKQLFMANLELVKGMCGICLVEGGIELGRGHSLDTCKKGGKFRFFDMKKQLKKKYGRSWVAKYSACTGCGLSQEMCDELAAGKCRYRDFAIPISWAVYKNARWEGLQDRLGAPTVRSEIDWMLWLGQRRLVFGETGTEMLRVTAAVLHELVSAFDRDS